MLRPRIKRTTEQIEAPNGDLYLLRPSARTDIQIENPDAEGRQLLAALDGALERDELEERFGKEAVADLLAPYLPDTFPDRGGTLGAWLALRLHWQLRRPPT